MKTDKHNFKPLVCVYETQKQSEFLCEFYKIYFSNKFWNAEHFGNSICLILF